MGRDGCRICLGPGQWHLVPPRRHGGRCRAFWRSLAQGRRLGGAKIRRSVGAGGGRVVGITGSVGKTSTKDLAAAVLARSATTHASDRSFNNEIGVPLTLLGAPADAAHVVVEMGARSEGDIADLAGLARPDVGVLTTVAHAHTGSFGFLEAVARTRELAVLMYDQGQVSQLERLDAERNLLSARLAQADARREQLAATATLFKALGGGWQETPVY